MEFVELLNSHEIKCVVHMKKNNLEENRRIYNFKFKSSLFKCFREKFGDNKVILMSNLADLSWNQKKDIEKLAYLSKINFVGVYETDGTLLKQTTILFGVEKWWPNENYSGFYHKRDMSDRKYRPAVYLPIIEDNTNFDDNFLDNFYHEAGYYPISYTDNFGIKYANNYDSVDYI